MKIKICGITNYEDAIAAVDNGADALGFIFYDKSKRFIDYNTASEIINKLPFFVFKVGVFVNEYNTKVNVIANQLNLNAIQIHGDESPAYCDKITHPHIKAFRVDNNFDFGLLRNYSNSTFLLDTKTDDVYGGTGKTFNWELIPKNIRNKIILAGGISLNNVDEIKEKINPQAIDISSSIEQYPGKKDHTKMIELLKKVKGT